MWLKVGLKVLGAVSAALVDLVVWIERLSRWFGHKHWQLLQSREPCIDCAARRWLCFRWAPTPCPACNRFGLWACTEFNPDCIEGFSPRLCLLCGREEERHAQASWWRAIWWRLVDGVVSTKWSVQRAWGRWHLGDVVRCPACNLEAGFSNQLKRGEEMECSPCGAQLRWCGRGFEVLEGPEAEREETPRGWAIWGNGDEWWIARSPEDATAGAIETYGLPREEVEGNGWTRWPDSRLFTIHDEEPDIAPVTRLPAEWIAEHLREVGEKPGFLASLGG